MASFETRTSLNGEISYRVTIRMKGHRRQGATFKRLTDATAWARNTEASIAEGRHFKTSEAKRHTVLELIERYIEKVRRENPKRLINIEPMLRWWENAFNDCLLMVWILVSLGGRLIMNAILKVIIKLSNFRRKN